MQHHKSAKIIVQENISAAIRAADIFAEIHQKSVPSVKLEEKTEPVTESQTVGIPIVIKSYPAVLPSLVFYKAIKM